MAAHDSDSHATDLDVTINGQPGTLTGERTLAEVLTDAGYNPTTVAVAIGEHVISRDQWGRTVAELLESAGSAEIDILTAVQGG